MSNLKDRFEDLRFDVVVSVKYHTRRRRFFESWQNAALFVAFIFSAATLSRLLQTLPDGQEWLGQLPAIATSLLIGLTLVGRVGAKAVDHNELKRRFIELQQKMELSRAEPTEQLFADCSADRLRIEKDEPPIDRVVHAFCYNETVKSLKRPEETKRYVKITARHRLFGWCTRAFDESLQLMPAKQAQG